jgi:hypothetical protein
MWLQSTPASGRTENDVGNPANACSEKLTDGGSVYVVSPGFSQRLQPRRIKTRPVY